MSTMEWMDPKGFDIWKSLSPAEKTDSVKAMLEQANSGRSADDKQFLQTKTLACVDKEAADPDYKGSQVPMYIPWTFCSTKYTSILENKAK